MFDSINSNVTTVSNLAVAYTHDYNFYNPYIPLYGCSVQAVYTDATPIAETFTHTEVSPSVAATGTFTVVDFTALAGKVATINGIALTEGVEWTAAVSNDATATSLAGAITTATATTLTTGNAVNAVVTVTANTVGTGGNALTTVSSDAVHLTVSGATLSGGTNVSKITLTGTLFVTGLKVALSGTNLPTGLSATNYWVIVVNANTIRLATSLANALAGTYVVISAAGTSIDAALTPASLGGVVVKLQASNDGTNFTDVASKTVTISAAGSVLWDLGAVTYRVLRVNEAPSAGAINLTLNFNGINLL